MDRYFNRNKVKAMKKIALFGYILFGVIFLPMIVIIVASAQEGNTGAVVTTSIITFILLVEIVFLGVLNKADSVRVGRYVPIIEEDHDGVITFRRLSEMTGRSEEQARKDIAKLIRSGYLQNVVYDDEKVTMLTETQNLDVICPTCGASNSIRFGSSNKCKHCGSYLRRV